MCASFLNDMPVVDPSCSQIHHLGIGVSSERRYSEERLGTAFCTHPSNETIVVMSQIEEVKKNPLTIGSETMEKLQCITVETILDILQFAMSCVLLEETIDALSDTHPKIPRITPHLSSHIKEVVLTVGGDEQIPQKRLENVLESYRLEAVEIPKDGDCLFTSIATYINLLPTSQTASESLFNHLQSIGIHSSMSESTLVQYLRELRVHE